MPSIRHRKIDWNAPVTLSFCALCLLAFLLNLLTGGAANRALFSVYRSSLLNPLTWLRLFTHVLGHSGWEHLTGNLLYILILGPLLEEKYGVRAMLLLIGATALSSGLVNFIFFPHIALLGASGVVFAMILLSSFAGMREDTIPVTFILVALVYLTQQIASMLTNSANISYMAHLIGGIVGAVLGFMLRSRYTSRA